MHAAPWIWMHEAMCQPLHSCKVKSGEAAALWCMRAINKVPQLNRFTCKQPAACFTQLEDASYMHRDRHVTENKNTRNSFDFSG